MIDRKIQIRMVGPSSGSVMCRVICHGVAPSIEAASRQLGRDALQAGEEQDDPEADVLPGDHDEQRVEHESASASHCWTRPPSPTALQQLVDEAVRLQHQQPDDRGDHLGQHVRREDDQPQRPPGRAACG